MRGCVQASTCVREHEGARGGTSEGGDSIGAYEHTPGCEHPVLPRDKQAGGSSVSLSWSECPIEPPLTLLLS